MRQVLYFNITYRCNQRCRFCFSHNTNGCREKHDICCRDFNQILSNWAVTVGDRVVINGGEPTLHTRLIDLINAATAMQAETVMYSNGVKFADIEYCKRIMSTGVNRVTIPVHGNKTIHDRVTGIIGSYDRTVAGIKNIVQSGFGKKLELKFIVSNEMSQSQFSPKSFIEECIGDTELSSIVIAGMVNTRLAQENGCAFGQNEAFLNYVAETTMSLRKDIPIKLYDVELCKGALGFRTWIQSHKAVGDEPDYQYVFFDAENLKGKKMSYNSLRTEARCQDCWLAESCRSITRGYSVLCLSGTKRYIVME